MVIFIRSTSVGPGISKILCQQLLQNCHGYLRTLTAEVPPSSLPPDTSIVIVGCGSPTLIRSYVTQTSCPYPVDADPSKRLYAVLGMRRSLSLGRKDPDYIQHTLWTCILKSVVYSMKRVGAGDALSAADMRLNGGEYLFEVDCASQKSGAKDGPSFRITWCHRMHNTRDHAETLEIRKALNLGRRRWICKAHGLEEGREPLLGGRSQGETGAGSQGEMALARAENEAGA